MYKEQGHKEDNMLKLIPFSSEVNKDKDSTRICCVLKRI